ncbi:MAG: hypothetical protein RIF46_08055, partial [Cyclobacteriaceae bacterium]
NMYLYMLDAAAELDYRFVLITYEQKEFEISSSEKNEISEFLSSRNIHWVPLRWHSGHFKLLKKFYDLILGMLVVLKFRVKGFNRIVSLATVSGSFAYIFSRIFRMRHYLYQYEPHSEFMHDFGFWKETSLSFKFLNWLERISGKNSEVVATGTVHMIERLKEMKSMAEVIKIPSCVNDSLFQFSENDRVSIRSELGITDRKVLIYLGKFGGIYFEREVFELFRTLFTLDPEFLFMVLTPNPKSEIEDFFQEVGISEDNFHIGRVPYKEVYKYISASDIGLVSVPPYPSQKFRSPIKVGEYLCCGIPYIVCKGISEDDSVASVNEVGIVLEDFSKASIEAKFDQINELLGTDKSLLQQRCREVGISYRGYSQLRQTSLDAFRKL